ncbi:hypothetical protein TELCIR_00731 [Teladorsagia circumcincta]|uniref:Uncharacterized protein n=1 Tax=Teladorsagia circumcincta TaxID=45464 RepID=A0A2G9V3X8_TELCI|nr:hypothetical protein TELCIR_00731 [Teladorsagia circumcincta]
MSDSRRRREWDKVEANLSRQTTLRMLSSIQIASKALSYHDVVPSWPQLNFKSIWEHTLLFLDIVFLHHEQARSFFVYWVYQIVLRSAVANVDVLKSIPRADIERVKADWMLLGASTVAAAAMCVVASQHYEQMLSDLSKRAGTPREDVAQMASAISHVTLMLQRSTPLTKEATAIAADGAILETIGLFGKKVCLIKKRSGVSDCRGEVRFLIINF